MNIEIPEIIDRAQWLQLLHVAGTPGQRLDIQMEAAQEQLRAAAQPRGIYRIMNRADIPAEGFSIEKHLEGCGKAAVLAVTLGSEIDRLIARAQIKSMAEAVVLDAGASVLAEQAADRAEEILKEELAIKLPGLFATPRFSPGYGDYPIRYQREILTLADAHRKIGITLTGGSIMIPRKSITALIGLSEHPVSGRLATCEECVLREKCTLRREGKHC